MRIVGKHVIAYPCAQGAWLRSVGAAVGQTSWRNEPQRWRARMLPCTQHGPLGQTNCETERPTTRASQHAHAATAQGGRRAERAASGPT